MKNFLRTFVQKHPRSGRTRRTRSRRSRKRPRKAVISRERGVEGLLRAAAQRSYPIPEDAEDPKMMAPSACEIRQSGRVQELQIRDLWLRGIFLFLLPFVRNFLIIIVHEQPRSGRPRRTRSRRSRRRRPMPNGNHHLGHRNSRRRVLRLHLHPGNR